MNKLIIASLLLIPSVGFARVETVRATGVGANETEATVNAIDNAIRQTSVVTGGASSYKSISGEFNMTDNRNIRASASFDSKSTSETNEKSETDSPWWKFWEKSSSSESHHESGSYKASGGVHSDFNINEHDVMQKYKGQIEGYQVVSMKCKDKKCTTEIDAKVFVVDHYQSPDMVQKSKYRVAVTDFAGKQKWNCLTDDMLMSAMEQTITKSKKMTVVDRANFDKQMKELDLVIDDIANRENKSKLKQVQIADYLLIGEIQNFAITKTEHNIEKTGEHIVKSDAKLTVSYKLIETATMDIVSSDETTKSLHFDKAVSCSDVAESLAKSVGTNLTDNMLTEIFPDFAPQKKATKSKPTAKPMEKRPIVKLPGDE